MSSKTTRSHPPDQKVNLKTAVPGPKSRALREREDAHIAPGLQGYAVMAGIVVDHAYVIALLSFVVVLMLDLAASRPVRRTVWPGES